MTTTDRLAALKARAAAQVAQYPQYAHHFDGWVEVLITRKFATKMGVAFTQGERTLARPDDGRGWRDVWSFRNRITTSAPSTIVLNVQ